MKNCIILGSGRSGTSMVTGALAQAGYFMGNRPTPATTRAQESNPKGQYEDLEINEINEIILDLVVPKRPWLLGKFCFRDRPIKWQRWLARVPLDTQIPSPLTATKRIELLTQTQPFCFKDPRFSYSLPVWRPHLKNVVFICVFRDPASTAQSILKQSKFANHLRDFSINFDQALEMWALMYQHILEIHSQEGEWLFLEYNQVLTEEGLEKLENFTRAKVDRTFPDGSIRRTKSFAKVPEPVQEIYQKLCIAANYKL